MIVTKEIGTKLKDTTMESPIYLDVRKEPFSLHGFSAPFRRVPADIAAATSETVDRLSRATAGGRVRFRTTSDYIVVHAEVSEIGDTQTSSFSAQNSFDIFMKEKGTYCFRGIFIPSQGAGKTYIESRRRELWKNRRKQRGGYIYTVLQGKPRILREALCTFPLRLH